MPPRAFSVIDAPKTRMAAGEGGREGVEERKRTKSLLPPPLSKRIEIQLEEEEADGPEKRSMVKLAGVIEGSALTLWKSHVTTGRPWGGRKRRRPRRGRHRGGESVTDPKSSKSKVISSISSLFLSFLHASTTRSFFLPVRRIQVKFNQAACPPLSPHRFPRVIATIHHSPFPRQTRSSNSEFENRFELFIFFFFHFVQT